MKHVLRVKTKPVELKSPWEIKRIELQGADLRYFLSYHLYHVMDGILDPDISGKKPDQFIANIESNRLGDFNRRYILAAYDHEQVVGLLVALPERNGHFHIYSLGVLPDYRKQGVGKAMLYYSINDLYQQGIEQVVLDVHEDNVPAFRLYNQIGFR